MEAPADSCHRPVHLHVLQLAFRCRRTRSAPIRPPPPRISTSADPGRRLAFVCRSGRDCYRPVTTVLRS
ncbi:hypothetical protein CFB49_02060 [Burkholderia sp. AU17457]|nr:hypothetical protein CFB49_02060 [Burkholderia sp. AU17457]OXI75139.1 hypothetical protein CFB81_02045 [Burkholderia sp. AU28863]